MSKPYYTGPKSSHFNGTRFFNPWNPRKHSFWQVIKWKLTASPKLWPKNIPDPIPDNPPAVENEKLRVSFVGQATVLIQTQKINILTDPLFSEYASPVETSRTKRVVKPGIPFEKLPKIDVILISHNHYDHMDLEIIKKLWYRDHPIILSPLGNDSIIKKFDPNIQVATLDWDQSQTINNDVTIHLQPAQHWSARGFLDWDTALWGAFVIETKLGNIYFAGDTGYGNGEVFKKAKEKFGTFIFAILPIGTFEPRWFMKYAHMNPEESVLAHKDLGEPYSMAIHYATLRLGDESYQEPTNSLIESLKAHKIPEEKFLALNIGQHWYVPI